MVGGFTVHGSMASLIGKASVGALAAVNAELGGYRGHGLVGSAGVDLGIGARTPTGFVGLGAGIHDGGVADAASVRVGSPALARYDRPTGTSASGDSAGSPIAGAGISC